MIRAGIRTSLLLLAAVAFLATGYAQGRGRKYKPPPPTCNITVTVVRAKDGKPVTDAAVVFHPLGGKYRGNMELKTDEDGKASINVIPIGETLRLQVIADGFNTFGQDYDLPGSTKEIVVKLKPPQSQYSIYQSHPGQNGSGQTQNPK